MEARVALLTLDALVGARKAARATNYQYHHFIKDRDEGDAVRQALRAKGCRVVHYEMSLLELQWLPLDEGSTEIERELAMLTAEAIAKSCKS